MIRNAEIMLAMNILALARSLGRLLVLRLSFGWMLVSLLCDGKPAIFLILCSSMIEQLLTFTVAGYPRACKNSECNAYDLFIGQCMSFDNGVWAVWSCIDWRGK